MQNNQIKSKDKNIERLHDLVVKLSESKTALDNFVEEIFNKDVFFYDRNTDIGVDTLIHHSSDAKRRIFNDLFYEYDDYHSCVFMTKKEHEEKQKEERLNEIERLENSIKAMTETLSWLKSEAIENARN